jgi:hypothetical protein
MEQVMDNNAVVEATSKIDAAIAEYENSHGGGREMSALLFSIKTISAALKQSLAQPAQETEGQKFNRLLEQESAELSQPSAPVVPEALSDEFINAVILDISEIPDRDSPEGMPEAMIVTADELRNIIHSNEEIFQERGELILRAPTSPTEPQRDESAASRSKP